MEFDATFLISIISFIVFVFIMNKIFYAPILEIMQRRENYVKDNFEQAKQIEQETIKQTEFHNQELEKSRDIARNKRPQGLEENIEVAKLGGEVAKKTKEFYEEATGNKAISKENNISIKYLN